MAKIIYTSDINGIWQIMIMNADGSNKKQLTNARYRSGYPTMTFDGNYIFMKHISIIIGKFIG